MTNRQIETSREIRLWVTGIIGPAIIGGVTILASSPELMNEVRYRVKCKINDISKKMKVRKES